MALGLAVLLVVAHSVIPQFPAAWSTGNETVAWTGRSPFPFAWSQVGSAVVRLDREGVETRRWSIDAAIQDAGLRLRHIKGTDAGTLFAIWTRTYDPALSELGRALRIAKGVEGTRLVIVNGDGEHLYETSSHVLSPSVLLTEDRFLVYWEASVERSRGTIPELRDVHGNLVARLPEAVYKNVQVVGEPVNAFYTWSFPPDCCEGYSNADLGEFADSGILTKWNRNGHREWATDVKRNGRNPVEFVAAPDGHVILRYGSTWKTRELASLDGMSGHILATRRLSDRARFERDRGVFLMRQAVDGRPASLSVLSPTTLDDAVVGVLPEDRLREVIGPVSDTGIVLAKLATNGGEARWYALREGVEPRALGTVDPRVSGRWVLWSDDGGSKIVDSTDLLGGAR